MYDKEQVRQIARKYADQVRQEYDPFKVILFGSYVNGNPHEYSDIDIAVVFKGFEGNRYKTWSKLVGISWDVATDIETHLLDDDYDPLGFLKHVYKTGEIIYEKGADN